MLVSFSLPGLPQATHEPPSSLLRVAQQFALKRSERRTPYIGRFSGLIEGLLFCHSERSRGILEFNTYFQIKAYKRLELTEN